MLNLIRQFEPIKYQLIVQIPHILDQIVNFIKLDNFFFHFFILVSFNLDLFINFINGIIYFILRIINKIQRSQEMTTIIIIS
jgi:hypothetical protein